MLPDIQFLLALQELDREMVSLRNQLEEIPARRADLLQETQKLDQMLSVAATDLKGREKEIRTMEKEIEELRENLVKLKQKQLQVKTNQEYQAALHEMDFLQKKISQKEDAVLEAMEAVETLRATVQDAHARAEAGKAKIAAETRNLENAETFLETEIGRAVGRRAEAEARVPAKALALYNKLSPVSGGVTVAEAKGELCTACRVMLRPQFYQELMVDSEIRQCESCRRILYVLD